MTLFDDSPNSMSLNQSKPSCRSGGYLEPKEVMERFHHHTRPAFWSWVKKQGVPHTRISPRRILFPKAALADWEKRNTVGGGSPNA